MQFFSAWASKSIQFQLNTNFSVHYGDGGGVLNYHCARPQHNVINCRSVFLFSISHNPAGLCLNWQIFVPLVSLTHWISNLILKLCFFLLHILHLPKAASCLTHYISVCIYNIFSHFRSLEKEKNWELVFDFIFSEEGLINLFY